MRRLLLLLVPLLLATALPAAPAAAQEAPAAYGAYHTLRLKAEGGADLEARLEVRQGRAWKPVHEWRPFTAPPEQRGRIQYLCDLPLGEARRLLPESGERRVRLTVRRAGMAGWFAGSWQGEFIPPPIGIKAWTYWLPSVPPPIQSTGGLITVLMLLLWAGCILAVRAEAAQMGLEGRAALWRHAGWLHLPGALLFFSVHPAPPVAGIGRELAPPRRLPRT